MQGMRDDRSLIQLDEQACSRTEAGGNCEDECHTGLRRGDSEPGDDSEDGDDESEQTEHTNPDTHPTSIRDH